MGFLCFFCFFLLLGEHGRGITPGKHVGKLNLRSNAGIFGEVQIFYNRQVKICDNYSRAAISDLETQSNSVHDKGTCF